MKGLGKQNSLPFAEISQLTLRRALPEDVMDILRWRNDPYVCAMSRRPEPIAEEVHRSWFSQALHDPDQLLFIASLAGQKVGIVRFARLQESLWEVSITLAHKARGRGLGRRFLEMALECLREAHAAIEVLAVVRLSNEASMRLFLSSGFIRQSDDGQFARLVLSPGRK